MALYQLKSSFAGGELSPSMYGRTDIAKYDSGAAVLRNFFVLRYGGAANRPGFKFIAQTYNNKKAVLIPFMYSTDQNYIVEITAGRCQFYTDGGIVVKEDGTPYSIENFFADKDLEDAAKIKYTQSADVLFIVHPAHAPMTLTRYGSLDWRFEAMDITGGPFDASNFNSAYIVTKTQQWTTPGTYTVHIPAGIDSIEYKIAGAGGGGGGGNHMSHGPYLYGGNGGSGELLTGKMTVTSNSDYQVIVGAGGAGGVGVKYSDSQTSGKSGGNSSFGNISARGGGGGYRATTPSYSSSEGEWIGGSDGANGTSYGAGGAGGNGTNWGGGTAGSGGNGWVEILYSASIGDNTTVKASDVYGDITLTASDDIFAKSDEGSLFSLTHFLETDYKKGTPSSTGGNLQVSVLPKSNVYVESFGFWDGNFSLEKYDPVSLQWVNVRTQSGNRSQNYSLTEENTSESIASYRVTSTEFNTDVWSGENEKQRGYITIQSIGGDYTGYVLITEYVSPTVVKGTVKKQLASTNETRDFAFAAWNGEKGYPSATGFYEDRLVFAGSKGFPQTFWTSKTGDYYNFGTSIPSADDDGITATLNGGQMNGIKAIIAFGEMLLLTAGGEFKVSGGGKAITGSNVLSQPQEYRGVSDVNPVTIGSRIIYVQHQGNIIRDLAYSYDVDKYTGDDLNLLASHLFEGHKIISMAYQQIPNSIVWCVRDDGLLLGLTYIKEQDIYAWHQHTMAGGKFVSVCNIGGSTEDKLYAVIERGGQYYVEIMESRDKSTNVEDQFFVDSGITYEGEPTDEISGLEHLEGYTVAILADGNVLPQQTVENGKVLLGNEYKKVHVGLPIDAEIKTLPIDFTAQDGTYLSRKKRIATVTLLLKDSRGGLFGMKENELDEFKWRSNEAYGEPISLQTGKFKVTIKSATYDETQQIIIKQPDPLPMTVLSLIPEIEG
ncbi:glycine-rich domain-containing protein [Phascolarctobacterium faecium]|uniref:glycine-rich domain-containing protein n=1 Tax=Phascolarctobacterium faecium TaxID=33025 RepID=UPI00242B145A|nr:hypothetical protein [Phascolarctobacterium faecium]